MSSRRDLAVPGQPADAFRPGIGYRIGLAVWWPAYAGTMWLAFLGVVLVLEAPAFAVVPFGLLVWGVYRASTVSFEVYERTVRIRNPVRTYTLPIRPEMVFETGSFDMDTWAVGVLELCRPKGRISIVATGYLTEAQSALLVRRLRGLAARTGCGNRIPDHWISR
jgi:hypothetical protein